MTDESLPNQEEQAGYWNQYNVRHRLGRIDSYMARQREIALKWLPGDGERSRVLEVGCGTGWLSREMSARARVVGVDLSPAAVAVAAERCPDGIFLCGDFMTLAIPGDFDVAVAVDVLAHVESHEAFVARVASLLQPTGILVLMTQNGFVWRRSSELMPKGQGMLRNWPSLGRLRRLLRPQFDILYMSSIVPGGDRGILRLINSRYVAGVLRRLLGQQTAIAIYERLMIGRDFVLVARRRS